MPPKVVDHCTSPGRPPPQGLTAAVPGVAAVTRPRNRSGCSPAPGHRAPDEKHDDGADHRAEQTGALAGSVPAERLTKIRGNEGADDPEYRRQDEARRLVWARHDELGDHPRDEADDDGPDDSHCLLLSRRPARCILLLR